VTAATTKIRVDSPVSGIAIVTSLPMTNVFVGGVAGGAGGPTGITFTQASPSQLWTINHNFGYRPIVALFDTAGNVFDGDVSHPTVNQTLVSLVVATAGSARLT